MDAQTRSNGSSLSVTTSVRQLADRLREQLHLSDCSIPGDAPQVTLRSALVGKCKFMFLACDSSLHLKARAGAADLIFWLSLEGSARFHLQHEVIMCPANTGCIWPADTDIRLVTGGKHRGLVIRIDRASLELELSRLLGRPIREAVEFVPLLNVDTPRNIVGPLLSFIRQSLDQKDSSIAESPILSMATERLFLHALLTAQTSNYSDALNGLNVVVVPRHLRAVMRAIKASPEAPWHLSDMAAEAGVSVRAICESFRRFCACTPKQYVQRVRLARVREALTAEAKPGSIAAIAAQCGFQHPGRFAATYHKVYGETPSETIRQAGSP